MELDFSSNLTLFLINIGAQLIIGGGGEGGSHQHWGRLDPPKKYKVSSKFLLCKI